MKGHCKLINWHQLLTSHVICNCIIISIGCMLLVTPPTPMFVGGGGVTVLPVIAIELYNNMDSWRTCCSWIVRGKRRRPPPSVPHRSPLLLWGSTEAWSLSHPDIRLRDYMVNRIQDSERRKKQNMSTAFDHPEVIPWPLWPSLSTKQNGKMAAISTHIVARRSQHKWGHWLQYLCSSSYIKVDDAALKLSWGALLATVNIKNAHRKCLCWGWVGMMPCMPPFGLHSTPAWVELN